MLKIGMFDIEPVFLFIPQIIRGMNDNHLIAPFTKLGKYVMLKETMYRVEAPLTETIEMRKTHSENSKTLSLNTRAKDKQRTCPPRRCQKFVLSVVMLAVTCGCRRSVRHRARPVTRYCVNHKTNKKWYFH